MDDLSILNCDNRDEPVVIERPARKNLAMHFIFEDHDAAICRAMDDECVAGVQIDRLPISGEAGHQIGSALNLHRPTWKVIAALEGCVLGKDIEIVIPIDKPTQPT